MKPIKSVLDFITGRRSIIKENIGGSGMYLIEKMPDISSRKARTFFHHSIICCITDAFEYFLNIDTTNNIFYKNIEKMTEAAGERFIKWESIYHTLFFTNEIRGSEDVQDFESALFEIFGMSREEKLKYEEFKSQLMENEARFIVDFSNTAAMDIFQIEELNNLDTSFIYNFYYNCYTEFYRTYSKYSFIGGVAKEVLSAPGGDGGVCAEAGRTSS